ncbi:MAG: polyisoprenoid-binding protein [Alphaproteobacteria bacterium]|nr:polyisoprenoid-binding protein [Alphaproteobacteria bacterium]
MAETSPDAPTTVAPPKPAAVTAPPEEVSTLPAGDYVLDPAHASLIFRVNHLGFSHYSAHFDKFDAHMQLDPSNPSSASLTATVDPGSLQLPSPPPGFVDDLKGPKFLNVKSFPKITFKSTKVETSGARQARVTGDLTLHGVTKPVTLDVTYNGGYPGMVADPHARIGFSAHGTFKRSDFGVDYGVPAPGTTMGVGDEVEVIIEAEFSGPELKTDTPSAG